MIAVVIGGRRSIRALADYVLHDQATAADPRPVSSERVEWTACLGVPLARRHPGDRRATGDGFRVTATRLALAVQSVVEVEMISIIVSFRCSSAQCAAGRFPYPGRAQLCW